MSRVLELHFAIGLAIFAIAVGHVVAVHRIRPGGMGQTAADGVLHLADVIKKDAAFLAIFIAVIFTALLESAIHPDNFGALSRTVTPAHIEPEAYFLALFAILKSRTLKTIGLVSLVCLADLAIF